MRTLRNATLCLLNPVLRQRENFKRVRKIAKSDSWLRHVSVCLSARMEQLGSHWTDLNEI
jgi:hypothetical protein